MNPSGIGLAILALVIMGGEVAANKWIRKVTNLYWFWLVISIFYLGYTIGICWAAYFTHFSHLDLPEGILTSSESSIVTNALLLNLCPFLTFFLPVALIADPSRKVARTLAPVALIASAFVLFIDIPMSSVSEFTLRYIFIGKPTKTDLYYFNHAMNMFIALGIILNTPKLGWRGTICTFGVLWTFYIYVIIASALTGATYSVSGLHPNDFSIDGNYKIFAKIGLPPALSMAMYLIVLQSLIFGTIVAIDATKKNYLAYGDKFSGCWWRWYDYNVTKIKQPWGYFSRQWQSKHRPM